MRLRGDPEANVPHYYREVKPEKAKLIECDVVVYGGTPAGVTAAIQAARGGKKVALLSFNRLVGGLTSDGLTATDVGKKNSIDGLALGFYTQIGRIKDFRSSKAELLFLKMLAEAEVPVYFERCLESVVVKDGRLVSATMETGETFKAAIFVDATYEGDLLAAARVSYHVGREPASTYGESLGGQWQEVSWPNVYQFCRASDALAQIEEKRYYEPFRSDPRPVVLFGAGGFEDRKIECLWKEGKKF